MIYSPYEAHRMKLGAEYDLYYCVLLNYSCHPFGPIDQEFRQVEEYFEYQALRKKMREKKENGRHSKPERD